MKPEILSFDAAGTLLEVDWHPGRFAVECAQRLGWNVDAQVGMECYDRLLGSRWREYCALNQTRDDHLCDKFWLDLASDWIGALGLSSSSSTDFFELGKEGLYGQGQRIFRLFADTRPALEKVRSQGFRMIVLSNWDYSLHRVLRILGIADFFETVFASLQEGPEKPDPDLFRLVCERTAVPADRIVHIGDHPVDDWQGPREAGLEAIFLDRSLPKSNRPIIATLADLPEAIEWLS